MLGRGNSRRGIVFIRIVSQGGVGFSALLMPVWDCHFCLSRGLLFLTVSGDAAFGYGRAGCANVIVCPHLPIQFYPFWSELSA